MAANGRVVTVTTAATKINSDATDSSSGQGLLVRNRGAASVFLGGAAVTTAAGFELLADESLPVELDPGESLYGVCAAGTVACHVLEVGV